MLSLGTVLLDHKIVMKLRGQFEEMLCFPVLFVQKYSVTKLIAKIWSPEGVKLN